MDLIRKHLMIEGQIEKTCLVRILEEVTAIYRKSSHNLCSKRAWTCPVKTELEVLASSKGLLIYYTLKEESKGKVSEGIFS